METLSIIFWIFLFMLLALIIFTFIIKKADKNQNEISNIIEIEIPEGYDVDEPRYRILNSSGDRECIIRFRKKH